jgi:uncharacterized protein
MPPKERSLDVMKIRIDTLRDRPRKLVFEEPIDEFPGLCELVAEGTVGFRGKLHAELVAELVGALVEVEGFVTATVVLPCSRCLQPVEQFLELPVTLSFTSLPAVEGGLTEEKELTEDEVGLIVFEGDTIELGTPLEQELLMGLPQHPLCADGCAGLCPVCGADLNHNQCGCTPPVFHGGLAALKGFKVARD